MHLNPVDTSGGGGTPAGSDGQIQFNNSGAFGADSNFHWDNVNKRLGIGTGTPAYEFDLSGGNAQLDNTTNANQNGIIYKGGSRFLYDFSYGDNGTVVVVGKNLFIGENAGNFTMGSTATAANQASYNVGIGADVLKSNTIGRFNLGVGAHALRLNTTASFNTAIGYQALEDNTTGSYNFAFGYRALNRNTTGNNNFAVGANTLAYNTTGANNVGVGISTLRDNTTGSESIAIGNTALQNNNGDRNVAIGDTAMFSNTTGDWNTAIGRMALRYNTTGNYNIAIGYGAAENITTGSSNLMIGFKIDAQSAIASNQMSIGNLIFSEGIDGTGTTVSSGNIGIGVIAPTAKLDINGDTLRLRNSKTPASASDTGNQGDIAWDSSYFYMCTATNTWRRVAHATW